MTHDRTCKPALHVAGRRVRLFSREWLTIHGACAKAWAKRYGIVPFTAPCGRCCEPRETSVPFACGKFRGLAAPTCACGHEQGPYAVVLASGDEILFARWT